MPASTLTAIVPAIKSDEIQDQLAAEIRERMSLLSEQRQWLLFQEYFSADDQLCPHCGFKDSE